MASGDELVAELGWSLTFIGSRNNSLMAVGSTQIDHREAGCHMSTRCTKREASNDQLWTRKFH